MKIYLMRHGEASAGPGGEAVLTARGREQVMAMADRFATEGVELDAIVHSPKARARQTAEIVQSRAGSRLGAEERPGLKPDDDPFSVAAMLESATAPILVVSHLPLLEHVAGLLVENDPRRVVVAFATAQIACFEKNGDAWTLAWTRR
jgi:phosphohistidine phosphatase